MSKSSGGSSQQLDPQIRDAFLGNLRTAQGVAERLPQQQFAGRTSDYLTAEDMLRGAVTGEVGKGAMLAGEAAARNVAQYAPSQVTGQGYQAIGPGSQGYDAALAASQGYDAALAASQGYDAAQAAAAQLARGTIRDVNAQGVTGAQVAGEAFGTLAPQARANIRDIQAGSILNANLAAYQDPYTEQVVNAALGDLERSRQLAQQQTSAQAIAANAFGGGRQGVAQAETNRAFAEQAARTAAGLRSQGFSQAANLAQSDLARSLQAQQANQAQDLATTQQALALSGQFGLANQDAALRAQLANQGIDLSTGQLNTANLQQIALANQAAQNQAAQFGSAAANQAALANAAAQNQAGQFGAAAANQAALANALAQNQASAFGAGAANEAEQLRAAALNQAAQFGASAQNQAALANQQAGLSAAGLQLNAAGRLQDLGAAQQQLALTGASALGQQGAQQQAFSQAQLDAIRNYELEQQAIRNQALGVNPAGGSGVQSSSRQSSFNLFSDPRLKENVRGMDGALEKLNFLQGNMYNYKGKEEDDDEKDDGESDYAPKITGGIMSTDVKKVMPEAVGNREGYDTVDYPMVTGLLVEAVKELNAKVSNMKGSKNG